jgi:hypothetical protein
MAYTIHVYEELAVTRIGTHGILQQGKSTAYSPTSPYFVLLCATDVAAFSSSFVGTVADLIATSVDELASANGYVVGGKPVGAVVAGGNLTVSWTATGGNLVAKSALLCYRRPDIAGAAYSVSSPIAMVDFGGAVTKTPGQALSISWASSAYLVLDSIA